MEQFKKEIEETLKETRQIINAHDTKINDLVNRLEKTSKNIWTEQLIAQMIGAFFIILGFGAITWRAVSILETKFEFMDENIERNSQEILRVRDKIEHLTDRKIDA